MKGVPIMIGRSSTPICDAPPEPWVLKVKAAYEAGYYKTEVAPGEQTPIPWQDGASPGPIYEQVMPTAGRSCPLQRCLAWLGLLGSFYSVPLY
jgi:hypothetical protein